MEYRNRLPLDFRTGPHHTGEDGRLQDAIMRDHAAEPQSKEAVSALLRLLTRLANCGMDAGAPPLMQF